MKRSNCILLVLCFLVAQFSFAQEDIQVPQKQMPLVSKISASWCPYCGTWGWDFMEALMEDNAASGNVVSLHYSGNYRSQEAAEMTSNFGAFGQPQFFLNSGLINVSSSTVNTARQDVKTNVNSLSAQSPEVQTGFLAGPADGQLNIVTKTRFFQNVSGEYYLGLYLMQKSFIGPQAGRSENSLHKNVLRYSVSGTTFGELIATGNITAGKEVIIQHAIPLTELSYDQDNIRLLSIIWKKVENKYVVVNSNTTDEFTPGVSLIPTANRRLGKADFQFSAQPNVVSDFSLLKLILPSQRKSFRVELWSLHGQKIQDVYQGPLAAGSHQWTIDRSLVDAAGMYFLRLNDGTGQISRPIIFH